MKCKINFGTWDDQEVEWESVMDVHRIGQTYVIADAFCKRVTI